MKKAKIGTVLPVSNVISDSELKAITPNMFKLVQFQNMWRMESLPTGIVFVVLKIS